MPNWETTYDAVAGQAMVFPICRMMKGCPKEPLVTQLIIENQLTNKAGIVMLRSRLPKAAIDHDLLFTMTAPSGCDFVGVKPVRNGGAFRSGEIESETCKAQGAEDAREWDKRSGMTKGLAEYPAVTPA